MRLHNKKSILVKSLFVVTSVFLHSGLNCTTSNMHGAESENSTAEIEHESMIRNAEEPENNIAEIEFESMIRNAEEHQSNEVKLKLIIDSFYRTTNISPSNHVLFVTEKQVAIKSELEKINTLKQQDNSILNCNIGRDKVSVLTYALTRLNVSNELVRYLIQNGANANYHNPNATGACNSKTPLLIAIGKNNLEMVDILFQERAQLREHYSINEIQKAFDAAVKKNSYFCNSSEIINYLITVKESMKSNNTTTYKKRLPQRKDTTKRLPQCRNDNHNKKQSQLKIHNQLKIPKKIKIDPKGIPVFKIINDLYCNFKERKSFNDNDKRKINDEVEKLKKLIRADRSLANCIVGPNKISVLTFVISAPTLYNGSNNRAAFQVPVVNNVKSKNPNDTLTSSPRTHLHDVLHKIAEFLVEEGANVNFTNPNSVPRYKNRTPLMIAAMILDLEMVDLLFRNGAHDWIKDSYGNTALHIAKTHANKNDDVVNYLSKKIVRRTTVERENILIKNMEKKRTGLENYYLEQIKYTEDDNDKLRKKMSELRSDIQSINEEKLGFKNQRDELQQRLPLLFAENGRVQTNNNTLTRNNNYLGPRNDELEIENFNLIKRNNYLKCIVLKITLAAFVIISVSAAFTIAPTTRNKISNIMPSISENAQNELSEPNQENFRQFEKINGLMNEKSTLERDLEFCENQNNDLSNDIFNITNINFGLERSLESCNQELVSSADNYVNIDDNQLCNCQPEIQVKQSDIDSCKEEANRLNKHNQILAETLRSKKEEVNKEKTKFELCNTELTDEKEKVKNKQATIESKDFFLKKCYEKNENNAMLLATCLNKDNKEVELCNTELRDEKEKVRNKQATINSNKEKLEELDQLKKQAKSQGFLAKILTACSFVLASAVFLKIKKDNKKTNTLLKESQKKAIASETLIESLRKDNKKTNTLLKESQKKAIASETQIESLKKKDNKNLNTSLKKSQKKAIASETQKESLKQDNKNLKTRLKENKEMVTAAKNQKESLKQDGKKLSASLKKSQKKAIASETQKESLKQDNKNLKTRLKKSKDTQSNKKNLNLTKGNKKPKMNIIFVVVIGSIILSPILLFL